MELRVVGTRSPCPRLSLQRPLDLFSIRRLGRERGFRLVLSEIRVRAERDASAASDVSRPQLTKTVSRSELGFDAGVESTLDEGSAHHSQTCIRPRLEHQTLRVD